MINNRTVTLIRSAAKAKAAFNAKSRDDAIAEGTDARKLAEWAEFYQQVGEICDELLDRRAKQDQQSP